MADHPRVMVAQHGPEPCHARHDGLAAAGEAGEEVRLDEAREDPQVALEHLPVEPDFVAPAGAARVGLGGGVERVVLDDAEGAGQLLAQHAGQLGL